ncbi:aquaporin-like protein [Artomyces pyxidatus]|uniref:Aquaporin-like protein n=1 Tax=Artomyces pyxidatus TaxID=48021 RepID=A0ACB8SQZ2_9AGAM|nr:aquaporin-like protein [Artomyces pyxidatus]
MFGAFMYCYAGLGSTASYVVGNILKAQNIGSLYTIGLAYGIGVVLALVVAGGTSGGHFHPAITVYAVLFRGMPAAKGARYIVAQIFGAYLTCLLIYLQWKTLILEAEETLVAAGQYDAIQFTPNGPAGIFALYAMPSASLGIVWINEFVCDFTIGLVIFAADDVTNFISSPVSKPFIIGLTYSMAIWGYSPLGLAANTARDVGGRLAAMTIWGLKASGGRYAAIASLTNIPATLFAYAVYEIVLKDSSRVVTTARREELAGHLAHMEHCEGVSVRTESLDSNEKDSV